MCGGVRRVAGGGLRKYTQAGAAKSRKSCIARFGIQHVDGNGAQERNVPCNNVSAVELRGEGQEVIALKSSFYAVRNIIPAEFCMGAESVVVWANAAQQAVPTAC